jgi:hypothetical protein
MPSRLRERLLLLAVLGSIVLSACMTASPPTDSSTPTVRSTLALIDVSTFTPRLTDTATSPASTLPATLTHTTMPTPTYTPIPIPSLDTHQWEPVPVLILLDSTGGDGSSPYPFPPQLILYANGALFVTHWRDSWQLWSTTLDQPQICALLNTIEQTGFFTYDPSTYGVTQRSAPVDGSPIYHIEVNAWQSNQVDLYGLAYFIREFGDEKPLPTSCPSCPPYPVIPTSLRDTYLLLSEYSPDEMEVHQPSRLGIWIGSSSEAVKEATTWPLKTPRLADLYSQSTTKESWAEPSAILEGEDAEIIYLLFEQSIEPFGLRLTEGEHTYEVFARPLFPDEFTDEPQTSVPTLQCQPSDGILAIP